MEVSVGIDWFRASSPSRDWLPVKHDLEIAFGPARLGKGLDFYEASFRFANGAKLLFDIQGEKGHCIDLPGDALREFTPDDAVMFCSWLQDGRKCTRLDIRIDWRTADGAVGLIDQVQASCKAGELCRVRTWEPKIKHHVHDGIVAKGINLGTRGKNGSGRYVRIYDKGLESGECPVGQWERWESELTGNVAAQAAAVVLLATTWRKTAADVALGCADFRLVNGSTALSRRPRVQWWADLLAGVDPVTVVEKRPTTTFETWAAWVRRTTGQQLKDLSTATGQTVEQVVKSLGLCEGQSPRADLFKRPVVWQYAAWLKSGPPQPATATG
jgi:DNA relaxase NicK